MSPKPGQRYQVPVAGRYPSLAEQASGKAWAECEITWVSKCGRVVEGVVQTVRAEHRWRGIVDELVPLHERPPRLPL